jgi:Putative Actinobacterial Holin-X, holin superfamily III
LPRACVGPGQAGKRAVVTESKTSQAPQEGIAEALHDLSDHTAALARREANSALREMWGKARQGGPAAAWLASGGVLALLSAASAYRLSLRLLEKRLSPAAAAFVAASGYGVAAAVAGVLGYARLREAPLPLPTETARETAGAVAQADSRSRREQGP